MTHRILTLFIVAILASSLLAQDAASPSFFIESIEVRNAKRVSKDIVIAESRLSTGREYSEEELRDASTRLSRLPFLLSVDFSLEKGSDRGKHVLVLSIVETKPFFFALDLVQFFPNHFSPTSSADVRVGDEVYSIQNEHIIGYRHFVGSRGAFHVGLYSADDRREFTDDRASVILGYTQYDLFGTRAFATLNLKRPIEGYASSSKVTPQVVVGIPTGPNQTVTLHFDQTKHEWDRPDRGRHSQGDQRVISARWTYDTTNNPFVPTRGTVLSASSSFMTYDFGGTFRTIIVGPDGKTEVIDATNTIHGRNYGVRAVGKRFWEISDRNSISGGLGLGSSYFQSRQLVDIYDEPGRFEYEGSVEGGFVHSLWDRARRRDGDSLLELRGKHIQYAYEGYGSFDETQISAAWVRRSSWGTLRLGAGYKW